MAQEIRIRPVTARDAITLNELNQRELPENYPLSDWITLLSSYPDLSFGAFQVAEDGSDGQLVGYVLTMVSSPFYLNLFPEGHVASIAVAKEYRGQGIGRRLMEAAMAAMKKKGFRHSSLNVRVDNKPAIGLYKSLGYTHVYEQRAYYADGTNAYNMEANLWG